MDTLSPPEGSAALLMDTKMSVGQYSVVLSLFVLHVDGDAGRSSDFSVHYLIPAGAGHQIIKEQLHQRKVLRKQA